MQSRRDDLIDTALRLFYTHGYHATGIDRILAESGVAKMTLYKHFRSKDDLILAALQRRDEQFRTWLTGAMEQAAPDPRGCLLAMFDALEDWFLGRAFNTPAFSGCAFIKAAGEFADPANPINQAAAEHKRLIVAHIAELCAQAGADEPRKLAEQLALLKEGAIVTAQVRSAPEAARAARQVAETLLDAALGPVPGSIR